MADRIVCPCPSCGGSVLVHLGGLPLGQVVSRTFQFTCPICDKDFPLGYVSKESERTPTVDEQLKQERQEAQEKARQDQARREEESKRRREERRLVAEQRAKEKADKRAEKAKVAASKASSDTWDEDDWGEPADDGRSPNDDRSDSMNPNNDAYWASRGG